MASSPPSAEALLRHVCDSWRWRLSFLEEHLLLGHGEELHGPERALQRSASSSSMPDMRGGGGPASDGSDSDTDVTHNSGGLLQRPARRVSSGSLRGSPLNPLRPTRTSSVRISSPDGSDFVQSARQLSPTTTMAREQACLDLLRHLDAEHLVEIAAATGDAAIRLAIAIACSQQKDPHLNGRDVRRITDRVLSSRVLAKTGGDADLVKAAVGDACMARGHDAALALLDVVFQARPDIAALLDDAVADTVAAKLSRRAAK